MVLLFVVVELVLLVRNRLEIGNFCFLAKGHLGGGGEELLTLLLARRRKRRRLRVHDDGKNEALPLVVKVVDVIIFIIILSVMPFCVQISQRKRQTFHVKKEQLCAFI
mgnify:FL=1